MEDLAILSPMLGMFLRSRIAIVLAILGLLLLAAGIGQRTVWLPPATVTASVNQTVKASPLTVIGPDVLASNDSDFTMTIKASGPIQVAVGRADDVAGWVGDAAHFTVTGANSDFTALEGTSTAGTAKVPNPSGSDMWVSEQKGTGEMTYQFKSPGHGDWELLVSSDGTAAAPTDISITKANDTATLWAVPLMVLGSLLLALAALFFWVAPRQPKPAAASNGRRAAGRTPADPATGALAVQKIVDNKEKAAKATTTASTIADARQAETGTEADAATAEPATTSLPAGPAQADAAGVWHAAEQPGTSSIPLTTADTSADTAPDSDTDNPASEAASTDENSEPEQKDSDDDSDDSGTTPGGGAGSNGTESTSPTSGESPEAAAAEPKQAPGKKGRGKAFFTGQAPKKAKWGAALAAVLVAGSISPAVAADTTPSPTATGMASSSATAPATTGAPTASPSAAATSPQYPVLLDSQLERILNSVATVVTTGDNAKNAKELAPRVTGAAINMRAANYKIRSQVSTYAALPPVASSKLLTSVVTTTPTWPRAVVAVTQGDKNTLPQLLTLVQASARDNYKLTDATALLPGQTFPTFDAEGNPSLALNSAEGLKMSPADAISALSDRLVNSTSKWASSFKPSVYITDVQAYQAQIKKDAKDANIVFTHKPDEASSLAFRTADGGAMVVANYTFGVDATAKSDAKLSVGAEAAVFTGGKQTTTGFVLTFAEPVVMYIPPASANGQINILSATRGLVGAKFK
jgi:hypothetical protein